MWRSSPYYLRFSCLVIVFLVVSAIVGAGIHVVAPDLQLPIKGQALVFLVLGIIFAITGYLESVDSRRGLKVPNGLGCATPLATALIGIVFLLIGIILL